VSINSLDEVPRLDGQQRASYRNTKSELTSPTPATVAGLLNARRQLEEPLSPNETPLHLGFGRSDLEGLGRNAPAHHGLWGSGVMPASATHGWAAAIREAGVPSPDKKSAVSPSTLASLYKQSIGLR
jgi:hypothetical protein